MIIKIKKKIKDILLFSKFTSIEKLNIRKKIVFGKKKIKIPYTYIRTLEESHKYYKYFNYHEKFEEPEAFTCNLQNVLIYGSSGVIEYKNKMIVESAFDESRFKKTSNYSLNYKKNEVIELEKGLYTSILHLPWSHSSNYHWIIDCLSRVHLLKNYFDKDMSIIIHDDALNYQVELLKYCIPSHWKIIKINKKEIFKLNNFILPSFPINHNSGYLNPKISNFIKESIFKGYQITPNKNPIDYIYISRKNAKLRKINNENKLLTLLNKYNFKIIYAENLSYKEQVNIFNNAKIIISPHGAGLTNILFSNNCTVIEFHPKHRVKTHYCLLSLSLDFKYYSLFLDNTENDNMDISNQNINELKKILINNI